MCPALNDWESHTVLSVFPWPVAQETSNQVLIIIIVVNYNYYG